MTEALYSAQWYRIARLRPRLRAHVSARPQQWRDQRWTLLSDRATGRQHRINDQAWQFIGRCDGQRTVHEVWTSLLETQATDAPTQADVLRLLGQLNESELLQSELASDADTLIRRHDERRKARRRNMLNPFAFRLPLADPSSWLPRLDGLGRALFSPLAFWLWIVLLTVAGLGAVTEWSALRTHATQYLFSTSALASAWVLYPLMKVVHEGAHALAVRRWGGEVPEIGIGLLFFVPAPYVDASAATAFPHRHERAIVGAAGILAELTMAALALGVWSVTQPGLVHDAALMMMTIGVASTLLFNGNPLLRFDAYHVMCDAFDLPNLGSRSSAWWGNRLSRWLLATHSEIAPPAAGERKWLWAYAPLSFGYRIALSMALILWLGTQWIGFALLATVWFAVTLLLLPLRAWTQRSMQAATPGRGQARVRLRLGLLGAGLAAVVFIAPMPHTTIVPAVVWLPDEARVRAEVEGFVADLPLADGSKVAVGDLLVRLSNPALLPARDAIAARLDGLLAEKYRLLLSDPNGAHGLSLEIERSRAELAHAEARVAQLEVRAQVSGTLSMPHQRDLPGAWFSRGAVLGNVLSPAVLRVRAAVSEEDAYLVSQRLTRIDVRLADEPGRVVAGTLTGDTPAATRQVPSAALLDLGGGPFASDPAQKDGLHLLQPVFLFDLTLAGRPLERVGGRAWVRFDHGNEVLAKQAWRRMSQLLLQHVHP